MRFSRAIERQHRIRRSRFIVRDSSHPPNIEGSFSQKNSTHRTDRPRLECFSTPSDPDLHPNQPAPKEHPCPRSSSHSWFGNGFHRLSMIGMPENWEGEPSTVHWLATGSVDFGDSPFLRNLIRSGSRFILTLFVETRRRGSIETGIGLGGCGNRRMSCRSGS